MPGTNHALDGVLGAKKAEAEFSLTDEEQHSPLWKKLKAHYESRIQALREKNDDVNRTELKTTLLRGRIRELKYLSTLDSSTPDAELNDGFQD